MIHVVSRTTDNMSYSKEAIVHSHTRKKQPVRTERSPFRLNGVRSPNPDQTTAYGFKFIDS